MHVRYCPKVTDNKTFYIIIFDSFENVTGTLENSYCSAPSIILFLTLVLTTWFRSFHVIFMYFHRVASLKIYKL